MKIEKSKINKIIISCISIFLCCAIIIVSVLFGIGVIPKTTKFTMGNDIQSIDLSVSSDNVPDDLKYLYEYTVVDDSANYLAHPDSVLLKDMSLLQVYPTEHGRGAINSKISYDGGLTYNGKIENQPESWVDSQETPTIYRLEFTDGKTSDELILISANPDWGDGKTTGGFNCSVSKDEGKTWSEFELFYPKKADGGVVPIVAMASLTQLKENGKFVDKWMGFFHDKFFNNYKSILTFTEDGNPQWSKPEKYFTEYKRLEKSTNMCEVEVIRSEAGKGDELCLISRSNTKLSNSLISFSNDEGKTWSKPKELPGTLNGERYKAEYAPDGRLVIVFRSIVRDKDLVKKYSEYAGGTPKSWISNGPVMWVGTYEDLKNGNDGQYRIKMMHTYFDSQTEPMEAAHADTGYCGNTVMPDGTFVISTYGKFDTSKTYTDDKGNNIYKTSIASKRINLNDIDKLAKLQSNKWYKLVLFNKLYK